MSHRINRTLRRLYPVVGAGILLQAGSCAVDVNELAAGLTTSIVNQVLTTFIFGLFNLAAI